MGNWQFWRIVILATSSISFLVLMACYRIKLKTGKLKTQKTISAVRKAMPSSVLLKKSTDVNDTRKILNKMGEEARQYLSRVSSGENNGLD